MMDAFAKYKNTALAISSPSQQLGLIFDESVRLLYMAKKAIDEKNYEVKFNSIIKIIEAFSLLKSSVMEEDSNPDTKTLSDFYAATILKLEQINIQDHPEEEINMMIEAFSKVRNAIKEGAA